MEAEANRENVVFYNIHDYILKHKTNLFNLDHPIKKPVDRLYVLSNESNLNGAAVIAIEGVLEKVGFLLDSDYYILPSSINELMIYPATGPMKTKHLKEIVNDANATAVSDHDYLSDKVHYYDRKSKRLIPKY